MHTSGFSGALPGNDDSESTTTTPPTIQGRRKLEADGGICSNPRREPWNVSPTTSATALPAIGLLLSKAREARSQRNAELKVGMTKGDNDGYQA